MIPLAIAFTCVLALHIVMSRYPTEDDGLTDAQVFANFGRGLLWMTLVVLAAVAAMWWAIGEGV